MMRLACIRALLCPPVLIVLVRPQMDLILCGCISFESEKTNTSFASDSVRGISFSNRLENDQKVNSVKDLSPKSRKIYKIADLVSANFAETTVIPLSTIPKELSLVRNFDWKDVLFENVGDAFHMIKARYFR